MRTARLSALLPNAAVQEHEARLSCHAFVGVHAHQHQPEMACAIHTFYVHLDSPTEL